MQVGDRYQGRHACGLGKYVWQITEWNGDFGIAVQINKDCDRYGDEVQINRSYYDPRSWRWIGNFTKASETQKLYHKLCS